MLAILYPGPSLDWAYFHDSLLLLPKIAGYVH